MEINVGGVWGTVCSDGWDINDAQVVCRMLNLSAATATPKDAAYGEGRGPIWLGHVQCRGNENYLLNCPHYAHWYTGCGHNDDAGVVCGSLETGSKQNIVKIFASVKMLATPEICTCDVDTWKLVSLPNIEYPETNGLSSRLLNELDHIRIKNNKT